MLKKLMGQIAGLSKRLLVFLAYSFLALVLIIFLLIIWISVDLMNKPKPAPPIQLPPLLGNMGGINMAFPRTQYDYPSVYYTGHKDAWGSINKGNDADFIPQQDTPISEFRVMVRMSDFKQSTSQEDIDDFVRTGLSDYEDKNRPPARMRWMEVLYLPALYAQTNGDLKQLFDAHLHEMQAHLATFTPRPDQFGLKHIASEGEAFHSMMRLDDGSSLSDTFFFDESHWRTFIECERSSDSPAGRQKISCSQYFEIPELKVVARADYHTYADLSQWQAIQTEMTKLALSYIVPNPNTSNPNK